MVDNREKETPQRLPTVSLSCTRKQNVKPVLRSTFWTTLLFPAMLSSHTGNS